jgi:hypothetical protein
MPVRNEAWVLGLSARAALMWCDQLIVADHWSDDGSRYIMNAIHDEYGADRFLIRDWRDVEWTEMAQRQMLLEEAREHGATHIALIDADEVLTGNLLPLIRRLVETTPAGSILQLPWLCLRDGISDVMTSGLWGRATVSAAFPDDPRYHWAAQGPDAYHFHHRHPMGLPFSAYQPIKERSGGMIHLQFASRRRLLAKQALYQAIEVIRWPGRKSPAAIREMYAKTVTEAAAAATRSAPAEWLEPYQDLLRYLDVAAEPWQEAELHRLVAEHGREKFRGLNFFGVA